MSTKPCHCCNDVDHLELDQIEWSVFHTTRSHMPQCDMCAASAAVVDAPTKGGQWAFMCQTCWETLGKSPNQLGLGIGQRLVVEVTG